MDKIIVAVLFCFITLNLHVAGVQSAEEGSLRLVGGFTLSSGRVEIYHDGEWGTICDDYWDLADATVVCRWLGFETGNNALHEAFYGPGGSNQPIWLTNVTCTGDEEELSQCVSSDWEDTDCSHAEDAGAACTEYPVSEGTVRLMDARDRDEGRVEIFHYNGRDGEWGSICNDTWGYDEAKVVCNQMGYYHVSWPFRIPFYGPGHGPVHLSNVGCTGQETSLKYCRHLQWGKNNCSHTDVVGVQCTNYNGWTTPMISTTMTTVADDHTGIDWGLIFLIVLGVGASVLLIFFLVLMCCGLFLGKYKDLCRSLNAASTQGHPTAAAVSTENPQTSPTPS